MKRLVSVIFPVAFALLLVGCAPDSVQKRSNIEYKQYPVGFSILNTTQELPVSPFVTKISSTDDLAAYEKSYAFQPASGDIPALDTSFFTKYALLAVMMDSGMSNEFSVEYAIVDGGTLSITIKDSAPATDASVLTYKGVLIQVDKNVAQEKMIQIIRDKQYNK